ncbi:dihydroorotate dehydrogenase [Candidatus Nitrosotalea okcheonensis]|uniref:Dihydroorotate dehydrogenase n=1 Tax=Candidatus Nitrosotalea okcheonensis TaxID=1903276 RepID=A0A2H1FFS6_9ARCH|nr:dihydroorotate dehydrogenase [Candidatus Nitrosotalea okcheonensis]MDE1728223.1 dihydroorotate dehydrogenase [Nitrososphaerota archaeon]MDE1832413.1 dihydroorotate dehydrogenase [Nitrososphaerota archaeon]SMH71607.1 Dihydroorotate dehydrogenase B (NAD(+)), catalytic subunit [Candidatus Nitrosotalea okcheonensis]
MSPDISTNVGPIVLERPTMLASGILGISLDVFGRLYKEGAGALVTKSLSREPWDGYPNPTVVGLQHGYLNAVGLSNPGASYFAKMLSSNQDVPIIISLVGSIPEDFTFMIKQFENVKILGYELNLSCPHVEKVGLEVGDDPELVHTIVKSVKKESKVPVLAKVGLGSSDYLETVQTACESGIDGITAINTLRAMAIDVETARPILSHKIGGLSGPPIKPVAVRCVYEISSKFDIPIIGCGGISSWEDAVEFLLAGSRAIQVGSAVGEKWTGVFSEINNGISKYMEKKNFKKLSEMVGLAKKF